jgi:hypothetical protein
MSFVRMMFQGRQLCLATAPFKTEYGVVTITMLDTGKENPTGKMNLEYNDSPVKSITRES